MGGAAGFVAACMCVYGWEGGGGVGLEGCLSGAETPTF